MFLKTSRFSVRGTGRFAAVMLAAVLCLSALAITAYGAGSADVYYVGATGNPVGSYFDGSLTHGSYVATFYGDDSPVGGVTLVSKMPMPDVYITNQSAGAAYYYAFEADSVDAYYVGESGSPVGSYLPGSQIGGALVDTYVSTAGWARLGADGRIVMPALTEGVNPIERRLTVAAQGSGLATVVYSHTFRWAFTLDAAFGDTVFALIADNSDTPLEGFAILAAYDSRGRLAYTERTPVSVATNTAVTLTFDADLSEYPADVYSYGVFYWDTDDTPVFPSVKN
ncbi:MAG: hypothetical protein LBK75_04290 [Oscillospiraceae bacterium]|jgi:hypothetical protein|nr:hypothetical protein [Oscillospiraceae bacterium]